MLDSLQNKENNSYGKLQQTIEKCNFRESRAIVTNFLSSIFSKKILRIQKFLKQFQFIFTKIKKLSIIKRKILHTNTTTLHFFYSCKIL